MRALIKDSVKGVVLREKPSPEIHRGDEVRISVLRAALCRTDVYVAQGRLDAADGRILGHECSGRVIEIGPAVTHLKVGDLVLVNPSLPCGRCPDCCQKAFHLCTRAGFLGWTHDGAFADELVLAESQLQLVPLGLSLEAAAYAEPLAATMAVLDAGLDKEAEIAVYGSGRIAELTAMILTDHGYSRLSMAQTLEQEDSFDAIVETGLDQGGLRPILNSLRPGGTLVLKSRTPQDLELPALPWIRKRLSIKAVHYAPFPAAVNYLQMLGPRLDRFVGKPRPLEDFEALFQESRMGEATKLYFKISE